MEVTEKNQNIDINIRIYIYENKGKKPGHYLISKLSSFKDEMAMFVAISQSSSFESAAADATLRTESGDDSCVFFFLVVLF